MLRQYEISDADAQVSALTAEPQTQKGEKPEQASAVKDLPEPDKKTYRVQFANPIRFREVLLALLPSDSTHVIELQRLQ
jgi:hypothetical protein